MNRFIGKLLLGAMGAWLLQSLIAGAAQRTQKRRTIKRDDHDQLQRWEGEGGNPAPAKPSPAT